jgi:predicted esterase
MRTALLLLAALCLPSISLAQLVVTPDTDTLPLTHGLAIGGVSNSARRTINIDAVAAAIIDGKLTGASAPRPGDQLDLPATLRAGKAKWFEIKTGEDGSLSIPRNGYICCTVTAEQGRAMILEARGHGVVYVNGQPRVGDAYAAGYVRLPVALRQGDNTFLFGSGRGGMLARLVAPVTEIELNTLDLTTPDILLDTQGPGPEGAWLMAIPVLNCGDAPRRLEITSRVEGDTNWGPAETFTVAPLSFCKTPAMLKTAAKAGQNELVVEFRIADPRRPDETLATAQTRLAIRRPDEKHKRTFRSTIDNSVQYYAVVPPAPPADGAKGGTAGRPDPAAARIAPTAESAAAVPAPLAPLPALVLSLHGASVEATSQARCYAQRPDMVIVCPTNRRPYGFDWEDTGRTDALEVLRDAAAIYKTDPSRTYLTGHSMGGHGTWQLGALFPQLFAAVAPSAGWLSFDTYTGRGKAVGVAEDDPIAAMIKRGTANSNTIGLLPNLAGKPLYILHGTADDNVPLTQAHLARDELAKLNITPQMHEQEGAGHWWGDECVDWPGIFQMFADSRLPGLDAASGSQRHRLTVLQCGASGDAGGPVIVDQQERSGLPSTIDLTFTLAGRQVSGTTTNVARLAIDPVAIHGKGHAKIQLDGDTFEAPVAPGVPLLLAKIDGHWKKATGAGPVKSASLAGPFKQAFTSNFVFVYGTAGTPEENTWALAKARYDGEQWWYRGNGRATVLTDSQYLLDKPAANVVLYGNADTNRAWPVVLGASAVDLRRGKLAVGDKLMPGDDAACLFIQPWGESEPRRLAAAIGGTGLKGMRATDRLPYFLSGTGFPDLLVMRASTWTDGYASVLGAGFFDNRWGVKDAEIVWRPGNPPMPAAPKLPESDDPTQPAK